MGKFADECLKYHNECRKRHGVSPLKLSGKLSKHAQNWADHLLKLGILEHSECKLEDKQIGENIASKSSTGTVTKYTGEEVTKQWYSEEKDYDYKATTHDMNAGHFTQVVWKDSKELGVGIATNQGRCIVVANYLPAGNFVGRFNDNVQPPTLKAKVKGLFSKKDKDGSSSSSEDEETNNNLVKPTGNYTRKVTVTKTITKPDGTVETVTEERIEEGPAGVENHFKDLTVNDTRTEPEASKEKAQSSSEFSDDALRAHNQYRARHGAGALKLSKKLCKEAQSWADHLAKISTLQHSNVKIDGEPVGENIASKWGSRGADYAGREVTDQWYSEESAYDYSGRSNAGNSGHFSQVVWKGSKELGIGKAKDGKGRVYVVANYSPAGNFIGRFAENVSRPH